MDELACSSGMLGDDNVPLRSMTNDDDDDEEEQDGGLPAGALNLQCVAERVPPFLSKLFQIVSQAQTDHCVRWSAAGDSFVVADHHVFSKSVLPQFFKHSSLCSFIRQLNTYGFRKRTNMGSSSDQMEFFNDNFRRGHIDLLCRIKRTGQTKGSSRSHGTPPGSTGGGPMRGGGLAASQQLAQQTKLAGTVPHATKNDLMHVQGQVNALISEVRDMRTLMHQYMMEVDKRVNLFSMEMSGAHAIGSHWFPIAGQPPGGACTGAQATFAVTPPGSSADQPHSGLDAVASASLAAMVHQQPM
ncbi:hypothetical protein KFE25_002939 [Diacronema lutheri]|uniref:HSF-type DNA-binding domain-containing protein n=1 Tax=Diacronema lutheri TaxID=2081491 RepID=A0A8J5XP81_DIALT|nr:hypothetical protein KFE25_002939 [Diacronema lutheri]